MLRPSLVVFMLLASTAASAAQPSVVKLEAVAGIPKVDDKTQTEDVRFKNGADDRLTVPVLISGYGPFRFLVDTGADRTAISSMVAQRLNLTKGARAQIHTVAGTARVSTANVPDLELTRKPIKNIDAPILESENMGADGIIGVDSLRSERVLFDFDDQTLSIVPSSQSHFPDEAGTIVVQATRKNGRLIFTDAAANGHNVTVVIDTGAQLTIGNEALHDKLLGEDLLDPSQKVQLQSVTGAILTGDYMFIRRLDIGGITLRNLAIVFADAHTFSELKLDHRPALLLGMNAIRAFKKVSIDFANLKFRVVLPETSQLNLRVAEARTR